MRSQPSYEQNQTETIHRRLQSQGRTGSLDGRQNGRADCPGIPGASGAGDPMEGCDPRPPAGVVRVPAIGQRGQPGVGGPTAREDRPTDRGGGLA